MESRIAAQRPGLVCEKPQEKVSHFPVKDYHSRASGVTGTWVNRMAWKDFYRISCRIFQHEITTRRTIMAKGQQRKTKEAKKPKKQPAPAKLSGNP